MLPHHPKRLLLVGLAVALALHKHPLLSKLLLPHLLLPLLLLIPQ
jgi:hypothetical protein